MGGAASSPQPSPDVIAKVLSLSPLGRDLGEDVCLDVAPLFRRVKALQGQSIYAKKELRTNLFVVEEGGLAMITGVFALNQLKERGWGQLGRFAAPAVCVPVLGGALSDGACL